MNQRRLRNSLLLSVLMIAQAGCANIKDQTFEGFNWSANGVEVRCASTTSEIDILAKSIYLDVVSYLKSNDLFQEFLDYQNPSAIGTKVVRDDTYVRFDYANPLPDSPLFLDGGVAVVVNVCTQQVVDAALLGW